MGKVVTSHNFHPKTILLVKDGKDVCFSRCLFFPKNIKKRMYKRNNFFSFWFFELTRMYSDHNIFIRNEKLGISKF